MHVTLVEAKKWLKIPDSNTDEDETLTDLIVTVSEAINDWVETSFGEPVVVSADPGPPEIIDGRRQDVIVPQGYPIISVQGVFLGVEANGLNGSALTAADYNFTEEEIRLRLVNAPQGRGLIRVDYTWGYAEVPHRVKTATKIGVEGYFRQRDRKTVGITSKSKEGEHVNYQKGWNTEAGLPNECISLLAGFRRLDFGAGNEMSVRNI